MGEIVDLSSATQSKICSKLCESHPWVLISKFGLICLIQFILSYKLKYIFHVKLSKIVN